MYAEDSAEAAEAEERHGEENRGGAAKVLTFAL